MIKISAVVPIYNTQKFLSQCLESLLHQSVELEVILINDGSTDCSGEIAQMYEKRYQHIQLLHQENRGQSFARNRGLAAARGEYIFFCDSDDFIEKESLSRLYELCKKNDLDMIKTGWKTVFSNRVQHNVPPTAIQKDVVMSTKDYFQQSIRSWYNVIPWNGMFRRGFLQRNQLLFPEGIQFEDNTFHLKAMLTEPTARIMQVEFPFYYVRIRDGSTTTERSGTKKVYDQLKNIELMNAFLDSARLSPQMRKDGKRAVSSLVFTLTSYYYRAEKSQRFELSQAIPRSVLKEAIRWPQTTFQKWKIFAFTYVRPALDVYEYYKLKGLR